MSEDASRGGVTSFEERLEQMGLPVGSYVMRPVDGVRKVVAKRLTDAARDIPHFSLTRSICMDRLLEARAALNAHSADGAKISINDLLVKAAAIALIDVEEVNASFFPDGLVYHKGADIAIAVAIKGGLITPIVRSAQEKTVGQISAEIRDLSSRAKKMRLKPDEYNGGSFCVSNLGMFGVTSFGSILNPPNGAILSVGATEERAVARSGKVEVSTMMTVTLTCDHRIIDGASGARWLQRFTELVEEPQYSQLQTS